MRILALDLATATGWAIGELESQTLMGAGTIHLASDKDVTAFRKLRMHRRLDPRIPALYNFLKTPPKPDWIVFEDVEFASSTYQVQLWSSLRAAMWVFAAENQVKVECIGVKSLKSFAGHGDADKQGMAKLLCRVDASFETHIQGVVHKPSGKIFDDNAVDAIHLLRWGFTVLKNVKP